MASSNAQLVCPLCPRERTAHLHLDLTGFLKHIKLFHAHQAGFKITCGISGCQRGFTNFRTFQDHVSALHRHQLDPSNVTPVLNTCPEEEDIVDEDIVDDGSDCGLGIGEEGEACSHELLQRSTALFLLGLKEKHKLPQAAVQSVVDGVTSLLQQRLDILHSQVRSELTEAGIPSLPGLDALFSGDGVNGHPFFGLETQHQQLKYYKAHFNFIDPVRVLLGERHVWKDRGAKRSCVSKEDHVVYIPVLETLQGLLKNEAILSEVESGHKTSSDLMEDFCDGKAFAAHPLFSLHLNALQVFLYFDELEVCNPLGSKTKIHKLGIFYFTLGNLPPKHRSRLSAIHLVAIVKTTILSMYGMDNDLRPFVDDIKKLERGVQFVAEGRPKVYHGTVGVVSADNLGSLALGGFKESCSANRMCRHCLATKATAQTQFLEDKFVLRNEAAHKQYCALLEEDSSGEVSKEYGINRDSILNELAYFHVCNGSLVPDVMHDILEGALQYEVKLMLQFMIDTEKYFTLEELNTRLEHMELGYMESKDRPTAITAATLRSSGSSLKQKAAQMWLFGRILPMLVGDHVPDDDEHWQNFLILMEIVDHLFCPQVTEDQAAYVATLISDHHHDFCGLYPDHSIIPKMHFMVHMPRLMIQYGPLVRHWTMRFEAKHAYFKGLAQSLGNFINLPYSLAMRHQHLQCYWSTNCHELPGVGLEVGPGSTVAAGVLEEELGSVVSSAFEMKWVKADGVEFKKGAGVVFGMKNDLPQVGQITSIYVINCGTVLFRAFLYKTSWIPHFRGYALHEEPHVSERLLHLSELVLCTPIHIRRPQALPSSKLFIVLPHYVH